MNCYEKRISFCEAFYKIGLEGKCLFRKIFMIFYEKVLLFHEEFRKIDYFLEKLPLLRKSLYRIINQGEFFAKTDPQQYPSPT